MLPPGSHGFVGQPQDEKLVQMLESAFSILLSAVGISTHLGKNLTSGICLTLHWLVPADPNLIVPSA